MLARIRDLVFGYDICFLHAGNQFSGYVDSLANYLSHDSFRCYIERVDGLSFKDKVVGNAINSSTLLIVMATEEAADSRFIEKTIENFNKNRKTVIAIDLGFLKDSIWYYLLKNQRKVAEKPSFLENANPSNAVFDVIINAATFRVKNKILKQSNLVSAILVMGAIFFMLGASYYIYYLSDQLTTNRERVNASRLTVTKEEENARLAIEEADKRQHEAKTQHKLALATKMAVRSNDTYISDPTKAIRLAERGFMEFDTIQESPPVSIVASLFDSFYQTYALKNTFYNRDIALGVAVNDFIEIAVNGKLLVANDDGEVRVVNKNGETEASFDVHENKVNKVTFSAASQFLLTTSDDNTANLLTINGELIKTLEGHQDAITFGMIAPNGERLLTITDDSLRLWNSRGELIVALGEEDEMVNHAVFSPVEGVVAAAFGKKIKLIDFRGNIRQEFDSHKDDVINLSYSVNGSRIVSASYDSTAIIWSKSGQIIRELEGHNGIVNAAVFSPDRTRIVTVSDDQSARLWAWDGRFIKTMAGHSDAVVRAAFSPNSSYILTISLDNTIRVWDNNGNHLHTLKAHRAAITKAKFSTDSKTITSASKDGTIKTWPVDPALIPSMDLHAQGVRDIFYGPEGKNIWTVSGRGMLRVWDKGGKLKKGNFSNGATVSQINSVGKAAFMGIFDGRLKSMNASGDFTRQWDKLGDGNRRFAMSFDQTQVAVLNADNTVKMLSGPKDSVVMFKDTTVMVNDLAYNDDKELILATNKGLGKLNASAKLHLVAFTGLPVTKLMLNGQTGQYLIFLENGQLILTDNQFKPITQFSNSFGAITAAVNDFTRGIIFAGTADGRLLVFHDSGQLITSIKLHQSRINKLRLSADGKHLLTAADDNSAKICPTAPGIADWLKSTNPARFENL